MKHTQTRRWVLYDPRNKDFWIENDSLNADCLKWYDKIIVFLDEDTAKKYVAESK